MSAKISFEFKSYGFTTVGERGQVVIPKEVRQKMKIKPGDQFLVLSRDNAMITFVKPENFDKIINKAIGQLKGITKNKK